MSVHPSTVTTKGQTTLRAALAVAKQIPVASFDRELDRFDDVTRFEPKA